MEERDPNAPADQVVHAEPTPNQAEPVDPPEPAPNQQDSADVAQASACSGTLVLAPAVPPSPEPLITEDPDAPVLIDETPTTEEEPFSEQLLIDSQQPAALDETGEAHLLALLEAVVYVTDEPLTLEQIAKALDQPISAVKDLLDKLVEEFSKPHHGLTVREVANGYKMATKPEHHEAVRTFVKNLNPPLKLSLAALETLAVIAYKQPITAPEIMEIRGVQGAGVLKTLLDRKLITTAGRKNVVGKPILYKTTREFLVQFGLKDLNELPTLKEFEDLRRMAFSDDPGTEPAVDSVGPDTEPEPEPELEPDQPTEEKASE